MYDSFLSYQQLLYYLGYLINNELLTYDESNNMYNITRKGSEFLELCNKMVDLLKLTQPAVMPSIKWK